MSKRVNILRYMLMSFAVFLPTLLLIGQEIRTSAPEEVLGQEIFKIEYQIISANPIQEMPSLVAAKEFDLIAEPQLSKTYPSPFWGDRYYTLKISCTFRAKKTGKLNLPRIELVSDGQKMTSKKRTILVRELPEMGDVKCFVKVSTTKRQVSIGDTLTVTYKLYSTREVSNIVSINTPGLRNFQYQDLSPRRVSLTEEKVDGVNYKVYEIRKYLLQSRSLGTKVLEEGSVEVEYTYPTGRVRTDSWGRSYEEQLRETKTCTVEETSILVHNMIAI